MNKYIGKRYRYARHISEIVGMDSKVLLKCKMSRDSSEVDECYTSYVRSFDWPSDVSTRTRGGKMKWKDNLHFYTNPLNWRMWLFELQIYWWYLCRKLNKLFKLNKLKQVRCNGNCYCGNKNCYCGKACRPYKGCDI